MWVVHGMLHYVDFGIECFHCLPPVLHDRVLSCPLGVALVHWHHRVPLRRSVVCRCRSGCQDSFLVLVVALCWLVGRDNVLMSRYLRYLLER